MIILPEHNNFVSIRKKNWIKKIKIIQLIFLHSVNDSMQWNQIFPSIFGFLF